MRHTSGSIFLLLSLVLAAPAEEASLADCLPEDIPGGREAAAKALRDGASHEVSHILRDIHFAQEPPRFLPWKVALEGSAVAEAVALWETYTVRLLARGVECTQFQKDAAAWLESRGDMDPVRSARLSVALFCESEILAKRHEALARAGNGYGIMSLAGNPAAHGILKEMCSSSHYATMIIANKAASLSRATSFRDHFVRGSGARRDAQIRLYCTSGLLRLGDPNDVGTFKSYLADGGTIRRFEVFEAVATNPTKEVLEILLAEIPKQHGMDAGYLAAALGRFKDPRVLPALRELKNDKLFIQGIDMALWHCGRAGDIPFLFQRLELGSELAAEALRRLLGRAMPIVAAERIPAVKKWLEEHTAEVDADAELLK